MHALVRADRLLLSRNSAAQEVLHAGRVVLGVAVALTALGLVVIYSSSSARLAARGEDTSAALARQIRFVLLGAGVGWLVSRAARWAGWMA